MTALRPHEVRELLERDASALVEQLRAEGGSIDAAAVAGVVLERHQARGEVQSRLDFLWKHLEAYVALLIGRER